MKNIAKSNLFMTTALVLLLAGCYGKIGSTNIQLESGTLNGPKTLVAYAKPGQNTVRDVEIDLSLTLGGVETDLMTIPFENQQGSPIIQQDGNKFSYSNNIFLTQLGLDDSVEATWRFTFGGAAFTAEHEREKAFSYVAQINDIEIVQEIEYLDPDGEVIEPTVINGAEKIDIIAGQPITINVTLRNNHPDNAVSNFIPVRVQETYPGGSAPSNPQVLTRNYVDGIDVNETVVLSFTNVMFNAPSQSDGSLRQLWISVNIPPAPVNTALLEENTNNNFYITQQVIEILPEQ
ncbi:MAG: hypothetical protein QNL62_10780 [Gammaproteobacteria bacterium]|nr:hypothetical protein [Gammaproteobacteria bacterium]